MGRIAHGGIRVGELPVKGYTIPYTILYLIHPFGVCIRGVSPGKGIYYTLYYTVPDISLYRCVDIGKGIYYTLYYTIPDTSLWRIQTYCAPSVLAPHP